MKEKKTHLATSNKPHEENYKKTILKKGQAWLKPGDFMQSCLCLFAQEKTLSQHKSFLFAGCSLALLLG